jgi:hypothetical protein
LLRREYIDSRRSNVTEQALDDVHGLGEAAGGFDGLAGHLQRGGRGVWVQLLQDLPVVADQRLGDLLLLLLELFQFQPGPFGQGGHPPQNISAVSSQAFSCAAWTIAARIAVRFSCP